MIIAAISQSQQILENIRHFLTEPDALHPFFNGSDKENPHKILTINGGVQQVTAVAEQEHPDLLLLESSGNEVNELQILGNVTARFPSLGVIMLSPIQSPERLIEVMRVGVREALPTPPTRESLLNAVDRFQQRIKQAGMPVRNGKVLAFIPCKGGSGATFLASNLAYTLAAQDNKRVALIDFNLQFGDASLFLSDSKSPASIADVARQIHRLDGAFLASSMIQILPNMGILAAPDEPEKATEIKPEHVNPLLQVAIKNYDFVILDVGRRMDAVSVQALDKADMIFLVLQQTLPFIRDAKRLIGVFHSLGYHDDKLRLIVNRYDKNSEITLDDIQNTLKMSVFKTVPNNFSVVDESVNHGVPVFKLAQRSPVAKAIQEISSELSQSTEQQGRWFKRIFS
ncbi:MAG: AAA family ATPase [Pseudomonadota bacterium]